MVGDACLQARMKCRLGLLGRATVASWGLGLIGVSRKAGQKRASCPIRYSLAHT